MNFAPHWTAGTGASDMTNLWAEAEIIALAETAYFPVLRNQIAGRRSVKADYLRKAERVLPGRTHHSIKDRCYRISEVLRDNQLAWVQGWNPPGQVGQSPNSLGVTGTISRAILGRARREFGGADQRNS